MLTKRCDGTQIKDLKFLREFIPYLWKTRTESQIFFNKQIDIDKTLEYIDAFNAKNSTRLTLFQVFICACVRTLVLRPELNRFVSGRKIYQRNKIIFTFAIKKILTEESDVTHAKITFDPKDTLLTVPEKIYEELSLKRKPGLTQDEKEIVFFNKLPRFLTVFIMKFAAFADHYGLLPSKMIEGDPLFASVFFANLGSIRMDAVYHHLFEWGNVSMFATMGKIKKIPCVVKDGTVGVKKVVDVIFTLDNRISDGFYLSEAIDMYLDFIRNPQKLEVPVSEI